MTLCKQICILAALALSCVFISISPAQNQGQGQVQAAGQKADSPLLAAVEAKYAGKSFSADFSQTARLAALDMTETAEGKAWFSHPGKMRWQYLAPDRHEIITNGVRLWIFRPDENQVMIGSAAAFLKPGTGGAFLSDITKIRESFSIEAGKKGKAFAELVLTPKTQTPDLARAVITVALPGHEIQMVVTQNIYGDTTRFIFTNIRFKTPDPALFNFTIPDGTSVIEME